MYDLQSLVSLVLGFAALALEIVSFVDALRRRPDAFIAAGKMTRTRWLVILGIAALVGFVFVRSVFSLPGLIAVVAAIIYWVDVKPALDQVSGGRGGRGGPYGGW